MHWMSEGVSGVWTTDTIVASAGMDAGRSLS